MPSSAEQPGGIPRGFEQLGPCRLLRRLGAGGMGTVYLAELVEERSWAPRGARVAVKVLRRDLADGDDGARFAREAAIGLAVDNPAVVRTLAAEEADALGQRERFLVLEHVEGRTLREVVDELRPVPEALLRPIAAQVARALEAVHAEGVVHRDLKPTNVMIGHSWQVKLLDLGTARFVDATSALTADGHFVGTLLHASPEQLRGEPVGPWTDLYALGIMLHEAAIGRHPFASEDVRAVIRSHLEEIPPRLSHLRAELSPLLDRVVARLAGKAPADRFASAREVAEILEHGEGSAWWALQSHEASGVVRQVRGRIAVQRSSGFVGRDTERAVLVEGARAARAGSGRVVLVEGEAGVGKTRLLDAWLDDLGAEADGFALFHGMAAPGDPAGAPGPIGAALAAHFGLGLERALSERLAGSPALADRLLRLAGRSPHSAADPRGSAASDLAPAALAALVRSLASQRPVAWIVEDLHFASAEQRGLFLALARLARGTPLLLVGTLRSGTAELDELAAQPHVQRIPLQRLSAAEVVRLLSSALGSDALADRLGGRIARKTDGNPFFVLEVLRELEGRGVLVRQDDGSFRTTGEVSAVHVPSSIREMLGRRLRDLAEDDRALLDVAAVQGFHFDGDLVARVLGRRRLDVLQALARLERRQGVVRADGALFRFDHHQLQEVIAHDLPLPLASEYHELLASAFVEREGLVGKPAAEVAGRSAEFLVRHHLEGSAPTKAAFMLEPALRHLLATFETESALDLARRAVERLGDEPIARAQALLAEVEALQRLGASAEERRSRLEDAIAAAARAGREDLRARALALLGDLLVLSGHPQDAEAVLLDAERAATTSGEADARCRALRSLSASFGYRGQYDAAAEVGARYLALARECGLRSHEGFAQAELAAADERRGRAPAARAHWLEALRIGDEMADPWLQLRVLPLLTVSYRWTREDEQAMRATRRALDIARQVGSKPGEAAAWGNLAGLMIDSDDLANATGAAERSHELACESGTAASISITRLQLALAAVREGRVADAKRWARASVEAVDGHPVPVPAITSRRMLGDALVAAGELDEAIAVHEDALRRATAAGEEQLRRLVSHSLGRALVRAGRAAEARPLLEAAAIGADVSGEGPRHGINAAYLALVGALDPAGVDETPNETLSSRAETLIVLDAAGAQPSRGCLARARRHLETLHGRVSEAARTRFWTEHPVAVMLHDAERSHGERNGGSG